MQPDHRSSGADIRVRPRAAYGFGPGNGFGDGIGVSVDSGVDGDTGKTGKDSVGTGRRGGMAPS
jgi:hypothetical protein